MKATISAEISSAASVMGRKGGQARTAAKRRASRINLRRARDVWSRERKRRAVA